MILKLGTYLRKDHNNSTILELFLFISGYLLIYSSCWLVPYLFTDDYANLAATFKGTLRESLGVVVAGGRSIYAAFLFLGFSNMSSFTDLRILRFISILGIAITSWLIYVILNNSGWRRSISFIGAFLVGTLPAFQVYASWAVAFIFPWTTAITAISIQCLEYNSHSIYKNKIMLGLLSVVILTIALNVYQPAAMFFWVFAAMKIFIKYKDDYNTQIKKTFNYILVFMSSVLISFVIIKLTETYTLQKSSRAVIVNDLQGVIGKIKWFITQPLIDSANFVNINTSYYVAFFFIILMFIGSWFYFNCNYRRRITLLIISILFIIFSYTPNLLVTTSLASYRTQVALESLMLIYLYLSIEGLLKISFPGIKNKKVQDIIFIFALPLFSLCAMYNVTINVVIPQFTEFANLKIQLPQNKLELTKRIYYIPPEKDKYSFSLSPIKRYDEFGLPSSVASWAQQNSVFIVLHELGPEYQNIPIEVVDKDYNIPKDRYSLVVDNSPLWSLKSFFFHK